MHGRLGIMITVFCALAFHPAVTRAQKAVPDTVQSTTSVNFGVKVGFNSTLSLVSDLVVNDMPISEVQNNSKIGYFASAFIRVNFSRHFLQPEVTYSINRSSITFSDPILSGAPSASIMGQAELTSSMHCIEIPVLYGYHIIKEDFYSLAVFGGPKFNYIWSKNSNVTFVNFARQELGDALQPLNASFTLGVSVSISRVFFDFRYDLGINNLSRHDSYTLPNDQPSSNSDGTHISFRRRDCVLSFSLGLLF